MCSLMSGWIYLCLFFVTGAIGGLPLLQFDVITISESSIEECADFANLSFSFGQVSVYARVRLCACLCRTKSE